MTPGANPSTRSRAAARCTRPLPRAIARAARTRRFRSRAPPTSRLSVSPPPVDLQVGFGVELRGRCQAALPRSKLEVDGSLFYVDWSSIQGNIPLLDCGFGYNTNLGRAVSKGVDLQLQASPLQDLVGDRGSRVHRATYGTTV